MRIKLRTKAIRAALAEEHRDTLPSYVNLYDAERIYRGQQALEIINALVDLMEPPESTDGIPWVILPDEE